MTVTTIGTLLVAQDPLTPVTGLAQLLQTYGAWGIVSVLMGVVWFLFRRYAEARDKNDQTLEAQVKASIALVEEQTASAIQLKNAIESLTNAVKAMERRLENVEKKPG